MLYEVTITSQDGYQFVNGFDTIAEVRKFLALATSVMVPGETLTWRVL